MKYLKLTTFVLITLLVGCQATDNFITVNNKGKIVELQSCYDGDTCDFTNFKESIRFARIDTPEKHGPCHESAMKSRKALLNQLRNAETIRVVPKEEGYYGRVIAEVYVGDRNMNDWMLENNYAFEYGNKTCSKEDEK